MKSALVEYRLTTGDTGEMTVQARTLRGAMALVEDILFAQHLRVKEIQATWLSAVAAGYHQPL